jgi:hypothetical protein
MALPREIRKIGLLRMIAKTQSGQADLAPLVDQLLDALGDGVDELVSNEVEQWRADLVAKRATLEAEVALVDADLVKVNAARSQRP